MYRKTIVGCVCVLIAMSGCTRNSPLPNENKVNVLPTQSELAHANYGNPVNIEEFENAVRSTMKDPYSAKISCTVPEKGWYESGFGINYRYFSICNVNAKNGFGAYVGEDVAVYEKIIGADGEYIRKNELLTFRLQLGRGQQWHSVK